MPQATGSIDFGRMRTPTIQNILTLTQGIMALPRVQREGIIALGNLITSLPAARRKSAWGGKRAVRKGRTPKSKIPATEE